MIKVLSNFTVDFLLQALKPFEHGGPSTCTREGTGNVTQRVGVAYRPRPRGGGGRRRGRRKGVRLREGEGLGRMEGTSAGGTGEGFVILSSAAAPPPPLPGAPPHQRHHHHHPGTATTSATTAATAIRAPPTVHRF